MTVQRSELSERSGTRLVKDPARLSRRPNLLDYDATCRAFDWQQAWELLDGLPGGRGWNIAHEAVDRHAAGPRAARTAIRWLGKGGERRELSYGELKAETNRFANVLDRLGVEAGESVFVLLGRVPELYIAVLGALKQRCLVSPLFSAFGPEPLVTRLQLGEAAVLVTTPALYQRKLAGMRERLPALRHVLLLGGEVGDEAGVHEWSTLLDVASPDFTISETSREDPALLHFTSGTTGRPKGAVHVHGAVVAHHVTGLYCARSARRRSFLVHGGPRLGDRHQLWRHCTAHQRRHQPCGRSRVRRADLVRRSGA